MASFFIKKINKKSIASKSEGNITCVLRIKMHVPWINKMD